MTAEETRHLLKQAINILEPIPDDQWCRYVMYDNANSRRCALGHLRVHQGVEFANEIETLVFLNDSKSTPIQEYNDGVGVHTWMLGKTPKARSLACLHRLLQQYL